MGSQLADSTDRREMAAMIEAQRQQLFKASAVIHMCRYACASKFEEFDPEQLAVALDVVDDLIDGAAERLEQFAGNEGTRQPDEDDPRFTPASAPRAGRTAARNEHSGRGGTGYPAPHVAQS